MGKAMQKASIEMLQSTLEHNIKKARFFNDRAFGLGLCGIDTALDKEWVSIHLEWARKAHWRLILAKQGIRYVTKDGKSNE